jgi:hypothetical protein
MPLDLLRGAIRRNERLVQELHEAQAHCDPDAMRDLLVELDNNNADLVVALEELAESPPTKHTDDAGR